MISVILLFKKSAAPQPVVYEENLPNHYQTV